MSILNSAFSIRLGRKTNTIIMPATCSAGHTTAECSMQLQSAPEKPPARASSVPELRSTRSTAAAYSSLDTAVLTHSVD